MTIEMIADCPKAWGMLDGVIVRCANCGARWSVPDRAQAGLYSCGRCDSLLPVTRSGQDQGAVAVGLIGGAVLGGALGGPMGAILGGIVGAIIGEKAK